MIFRLIKSVFRSAGDGIKNDKELIKVKNRFPKTFSFVKKRLTPDEKFGLGLTIGTLVFSVFIYLFLKTLSGFFAQEVWVMTDLRVLNIVKEFRTPVVSEIMIFITSFAKKEVVIVGAIAVSILLYLLKRWYYALSLVFSISCGEIFTYILKNMIARPRPPLDLALLQEKTFSFPSGHAFVAVSFYGMLCYFAFRGLKKKKLRIPVLLLLTTLILSIGLSRIYLGVHWPSDVLAGLVSGVAWISVVITFIEIRRKIRPRPKSRIDLSDFRIKITALILLLFWISSVLLFYSIKSEEKQEFGKAQKREVVGVSEAYFLENHFLGLPRVSETISGKPMEPVHIIVIGSKDDLFDAFSNIGWFSCDPLNRETLQKIIKATIFNAAYPKAPGVPSLWNATPNKISFEKPTEANSVKERHHIHFWDTGYFIEERGKEDGRVWFATAHFDMTISMKSSFVFPVHTIDPAIDSERDLIKAELEKRGETEKIITVQAVTPSLGKNQSGDLFFTDGKAEVIFLKK